MAISGPLRRRYRALRSVRPLRLSNGLAWMALAQVSLVDAGVLLALSHDPLDAAVGA